MAHKLTPEYLIAHDLSKELNLLISTSEPWLIGRIIASAEPGFSPDSNIFSKCPGYNVYICLYDILGTPPGKDAAEQAYWVKDALDRMALFYYDNRIHKKPGRYKRYALDPMERNRA